MKYPFAIILFLTCKICFSQINFQENIIIDNTYSSHGLTKVISFDVDNDGDLDIVSSSEYDNKIAWFENLDGQGNFSALQILTLNSNSPSSMAIADLDNDGDMDIIVTSRLDDSVEWHENIDSQGDYSVKHTISTSANGANSVFASDIDNDGYIDIVASSFGDDKIAWYKNINGNGQFSSENIISSNVDGVQNISVKDMDNDGDTDIVSTSRYDNKVAWFRNLDGLGTFSSEIIVNNVDEYPHSISLEDLDNDNDNDIVITYRNSGEIVWYENTNGNGAFGTKQLIEDIDNYAEYIHTSDVDNDGDIDLFYGRNTTDNHYIAWYKNFNSNASFSIEQTISTNLYRVKSVTTSDIDNDGDLDLITASEFDNKIAWFENLNGQGSFGTQNELTMNVVEPYSVCSVDLDNDGDLDVLSASRQDSEISWFENLDGLGNFSSQKIITINAKFSESVFASDIDNDGFKDIIYATKGNDDKIAWHKNLGQGNFGTQQNIPHNLNDPDFVYTFDFDKDNDEDLICSSSTDGSIIWLENLDSNGTFSAPKNISTNANGVCHTIVYDIDSDGDLDVVASLSWSDKIVYYKNNNWVFSSENIVSNSQDSPEVFLITDIDGDNFEDIVLASQFDETIAWYKNIDGLGNFGTQQIITANGNGPDVIAAKDIDNDGDIDIISNGLLGTSGLFFYENLDGLGNFQTAQTIPNTMRYTKDIEIVDIDNDTDLDILCADGANNDNSKIVWYKNPAILSVKENQVSDLFKIHPNPSSKTINIKSKLRIDAVSLYDINGRLLKIKNLDTNFDTGNYQLNIKDLTNGTYFLEIQSNNLKKTIKILKK